VVDLVSGALASALDGLSLRERVDAANISNLDTPGYHAQRVNFEDSLSAAIANGDPSSASSTTSTSAEPTGLNGNNVNLDEETVSMTETNLRYQLVSQAMTAQFAQMRTAIGSGS
jgi:flagellar basal-body rod protein FlgB